MDIIPQDTPLKQCNICQRFKPTTKDYFHVAKENADGLRNQCKDCHNADRRSRYYANQEHENERCRTYKAAHKEEISYYWQGYYHQHQDALVMSAQMYRATYPERVKSSLQTYRATHREKLHAYKVAYRATHGEQIRAYSAFYDPLHKEQKRDYRRAHLLQCRAYAHAYRTRKRNGGGTYTAQDVLDQLKRQRGRCYYCHKKLDKYHIEHVVPLSRGGRNDKWNIVISCPGCNCRKHNKMPHEWFAGGRLL